MQPLHVWTEVGFAMLSVQGRHGPAWGSLHSPVRAARELAYAGVHFELLPQRGFRPQVPGDYAPYVMPVGPASASPPVAARATCSLHIDPTLSIDPQQLNQIEYRGDGDMMRLRHPFFRADVRKITRARYVATARVGDDPLAMAAFLRFVAAAIVEHEGGLSLHAAALALDGAAIALMGPSGAGKSTACELATHARGARCLAYDQLVIYPLGERCYGWALPWGSATELPRTETPVLPLSACLRVTRGTPHTEIRQADAAQATFLLRSAASVRDAAMEAEFRRLANVQQIVERVPVGYLSTVLDERTDVAIAAWLRAGARGVA